MTLFNAKRLSGKFCLAATLFILAALTLGAEEFKFSFVKGDKYRILSQVSEDVYVNRRYFNSVEIVNRIAFEVADVRSDGAGLLKGDFVSSVQSALGRAYVTDQVYRSEYWHLPDGRYEIAPQYFMPVVRFVPSFPARDLKPGDTWNAPGEERHDLRADFGIPDPFIIPIDVRYQYSGDSKLGDTPVSILKVNYTIFHQPKPPRSWTSAYPVQISGYSDQIHYWDPKQGGMLAYEERFKFIFELSDGRVIEYRGIAKAEVVEAVLMNRDDIAGQVRTAVADMPDVNVQTNEQGVTISLENIQFEADSARLLPGENEKIRRIAELLKKFPDRNLLVSGHTALAGTADARATLSRERARTVAEMLIGMGVRLPQDITVIGYGAERPVAENTTEAGRSRNRRVEITILEN